MSLHTARQAFQRGLDETSAGGNDGMVHLYRGLIYLCNQLAAMENELRQLNRTYAYSEFSRDHDGASGHVAAGNVDRVP